VFEAAILVNINIYDEIVIGNKKKRKYGKKKYSFNQQMQTVTKINSNLSTSLHIYEKVYFVTPLLQESLSYYFANS